MQQMLDQLCEESRRFYAQDVLDILESSGAKILWYKEPSVGDDAFLSQKSVLLNQDVDIVTDSRLASFSTTFLSLKGLKFDGHDFLSSAYQLGCRLFIIDDEAKLVDFLHSKNLTRKNDVYKNTIEEACFLEHESCSLEGQEESSSLDISCFILVNSTKDAYLTLAREYRSMIFDKVIGITGSVGKTSMRDILACALNDQGHIIRNEANLNNEIGVAKTILEATFTRDFPVYGVIEMGMDRPGDLAYLSKYVRPEIMIITNISESHIANFSDFSHLAQEKLRSLEGLRGSKGLFLFSGKDDYIRQNLPSILKQYPQIKKAEAVFTISKSAKDSIDDNLRPRDLLKKQKVEEKIYEELEKLLKDGVLSTLWLAIREENLLTVEEKATYFAVRALDENDISQEFSQNFLQEVQVVDMINEMDKKVADLAENEKDLDKIEELIEETQAELQSTKRIFCNPLDSFVLNKAGEHYVDMVLFSLAVCNHLNLNCYMAFNSLKDLTITGNRQNFFTIDQDAIFNDSYNASFKSYKSALSSFSRYAQQYQRKIGVFGSIVELGLLAEDTHMDIGELLAEYDWDALFLIGDYAVDMHNALFYASGDENYTYDDTYYNPLRSQTIIWQDKKGRKIPIFLYDTSFPLAFLKELENSGVNSNKLEKLADQRLKEALVLLKDELKKWHLSNNSSLPSTCTQKDEIKGRNVYIFKASHRYALEEVAQDLTTFLETKLASPSVEVDDEGKEEN